MKNGRLQVKHEMCVLQNYVCLIDGIWNQIEQQDGHDM
jgi:hypothetical protein